MSIQEVMFVLRVHLVVTSIVLNMIVTVHR